MNIIRSTSVDRLNFQHLHEDLFCFLSQYDLHHILCDLASEHYEAVSQNIERAFAQMGPLQMHAIRLVAIAILNRSLGKHPIYLYDYDTWTYFYEIASS